VMSPAWLMFETSCGIGLTPVKNKVSKHALTQFRLLWKEDAVNLVAPLRINELMVEFINTWNKFRALGGV
jgi:hypothetical protein